MDIPFLIVNGTKEVIQDTVNQLLLTIIGGLLGFLSLLISIIVSEKYKRKNLVFGATESLLTALKEHERLLHNRKRPTLSIWIVITTRQVRFTYNNVTFPIGAFDSILYSGAFREFNVDQQKQISDFYDEVKLVNEFGWKILEFITMGNTGSTLFQENMLSHGSLIDDKCDTILNMNPELYKSLETKKYRSWLESKKHKSWLARGNVNS